MADGRSERGQGVRIRKCTLRIGGRLNGVNVKMDCSEMTRIALQHRLKDREYFRSSFPRGAVGAPQVPWAQIHDALRIKGGCVKVVRIALSQLTHGILEFDCQLFAVWNRAIAVLFAKRRQVTALNLRAGR